MPITRIKSLIPLITVKEPLITPLSWAPNAEPARSLCLLWGRTLECAPLSPNTGGRALHF
jgi:hypothetical protein